MAKIKAKQIRDLQALQSQLNAYFNQYINSKITIRATTFNDFDHWHKHEFPGKKMRL